ncbi:putative quinol monooxygenase [Ornithinimicrobium sp. LYQ103]|uniref:putative quinol monooxygenase n=1 Tax=Ornithinimicrobium sp. LYQ103 TaxID=3378796 RepID=UPI003851E945
MVEVTVPVLTHFAAPTRKSWPQACGAPPEDAVLDDEPVADLVAEITAKMRGAPMPPRSVQKGASTLFGGAGPAPEDACSSCSSDVSPPTTTYPLGSNPMRGKVRPVQENSGTEGVVEAVDAAELPVLPINPDPLSGWALGSGWESLPTTPLGTATHAAGPLNIDGPGVDAWAGSHQPVTMGRVVIACSVPRAGRERELHQLAREHVPRLRAEGLVTEREPIIAVATDGTVVEVFEWVSEAAIAAAHQSPAVRAMWDDYDRVSTYVPIGSVAEAGRLFSEFAPLPLENG